MVAAIRKWRRAWLQAAAMAVFICAGLVAWDHWSGGPEERTVTALIEQAEEAGFQGNYSEAYKGFLWVLQHYPASHQLARVLYRMGELNLDVFGDMKAARLYFLASVRSYPFNRYTGHSLRKLDYINRMNDAPLGYKDHAYRQYVLARRMIAVDSQSERVALLEKIARDYPKSAVVPEVLFLLGEIELYNFHRPSKARHYYTRLRSLYSDHPLVARIPTSSRLERPDGRPTPVVYATS